MTKFCRWCKKEYTQEEFVFDGGFCTKCKPFFLNLKTGYPDEAKDLFRGMISFSAILMILTPMILDGGLISKPGGFFYSFLTAYFIIRYIIIKKNGSPKLMFFQKIGIILLPFYGFYIFFIIWLTIREIFFNGR